MSVERRLLLSGLVVAILALHWPLEGNPPGFFRDEAAIVANADAIARTGRDQYGTQAPLYFRSFDDYKSPVYVYVLAAAFASVGPGEQVARGLSSLAVIAATLLLAVLAFRVTSSVAAAVLLLIVAAFTPWLYELGRVAFEVAFVPAALALVLVRVHAGSRTCSVRTAVSSGVTLALLAYVYAGTRLLAPLLAVALVAAFGASRWRWSLAAVAAFAVAMAPIAAYAARHDGALSERFWATSYVGDGSPWTTTMRRFVANYLSDLQPWHWAFSGDPNLRHHIAGASTLPVILTIIATFGIVVVLVQRRHDPFWRFVLLALVATPIPAALTVDRFHALRLAPLPILVLLLALAGSEELRARLRSERRTTLVFATLGVLFVAQVGHFAFRFVEQRDRRAPAFEVSVAPLLDVAFRGDRRVYIDFDDLAPQAHALSYAATRGLPRERVVVLSDGARPPQASIVFGRLQSCDYACDVVARGGEYWLARAA